KLNDITKVLAAKQEILPADKQDKTIKWQEVVKFILFAFAFMIIGHTLFSYIPFSTILNGIKSIPQYIDTKSFLLMLLTGFLAQMADGSL
ncbi:hypothetical protein ABTL91_19235, partial [Acinetobacter baumannii]